MSYCDCSTCLERGMPPPFERAIAYVRGLDEQDQQALTAADALATAVEEHSFAFSDDTALAILSRLAEYRKIRPQEPK